MEDKVTIEPNGAVKIEFAGGTVVRLSAASAKRLNDKLTQVVK